MDLVIKLKEGKTLKDVAEEVQQMNTALAPLLVNGPISCNPTSETPEGFLGEVNTPPNEFGYVTVRVGNYRKLILPWLAPQSFDFVIGDAVEEVEFGEIWSGDVL